MMTPAEMAVEALNSVGRSELESRWTSFISGSLSLDGFRSYLRTQLGWNPQATEEYLNAACDASDEAPAAAAGATAAQPAIAEPVERRRGTLRPNYGARPAPSTPTS